MIKYESHCVKCDWCMGFTCPYKKVAIHCCDECGEELDEIYEVDDKEICEECLKDKFKRG